MRVIYFILGFLVLILLCLFWLQLNPIGPLMNQHPEYPSMLIGQYDWANDYWITALLGWCVISLFILCLYLGLNRASNRKAILPWLVVGYLLYGLTYIGVILADLNYMANESTNYFLGFPIPTAWMIFGMWFSPLFFSVLYVLNFDSWVISQKEVEKFKALVNHRRKSNTTLGGKS